MATPTIVQEVTPSLSNTATLAIATSATAVGNLLLVVNYSGQPITSITDNGAGGSNTWAELYTGGSFPVLRLWGTTAASPKSVTAVTVNYASATSPAAFFAEIHGASNTAPIDTDNSATSATTAATSGPATPSTSTTLALGAFGWFNTSNNSTADTGATFTSGIDAGKSYAALEFAASNVWIQGRLGFLSSPSVAQTFTTTLAATPAAPVVGIIAFLKSGGATVTGAGVLSCGATFAATGSRTTAGSGVWAIGASFVANAIGGTTTRVFAMGAELKPARRWIVRPDRRR